MFGVVNVWQIAESKVIGEIKFGKWIDFGHIANLKINWLKFGESQTTRQIFQTFPLTNILIIRYMHSNNAISYKLATSQKHIYVYTYVYVCKALRK